MNASVSGANRRLGNSTWSGRPVECKAEQITGTPASQPANRPQNILSPPVPTVTTASIRRRPQQSREPPEHGEVILVGQQARDGGNLLRQDFAEGAEVLQTAQFRPKPLPIQATDQFHQRRFRPADGHARNHEHHPQADHDRPTASVLGGWET